MENGTTCKETLRREIRDLSMILTAKDCPETVSLASLTFAEFPSPSVLPSSYFPTRISFVTIQESKPIGRCTISLDRLSKRGWDWAMNLWICMRLWGEEIKKHTPLPFCFLLHPSSMQLFYWIMYSLFLSW